MKKYLVIALIVFTALVFAKVSFAQEMPMEQPMLGKEMMQTQRPGPGGQPWLAQFIGKKVKCWIANGTDYVTDVKGELVKVEISGVVLKDTDAERGYLKTKEAFFPFGTIMCIQPVSE